MSGPTTTLIYVNPVASLLAASGIRAAAAIREGYQQAVQLRQQQDRQRSAQWAEQYAALAQGLQQMASESAAANAEFDELIALAERLGVAAELCATRPAAPESADPADLACYIQSLRQLSRDLRQILLTEAGQRLHGLADEADSFALSAAPPTPQVAAQRLMARLAHLDDIPPALAELARELEQTLPGERADLLASELRSRIQAHLQAVQQAQVQAATATIVEQSLHDLGYQVEEVAHTLFVSGGVVHFRRPGWGNYWVRLRLDAAAGTANFNVIRAVAAGENERSVLDHLAEDRWCAEFPALLKALEARGVQLQVTRRLQAGELPVQLVVADKLPAITDEEEHAREQQQALSRKL